MTDAVTAADYLDDSELFGHPKGLYVCFATELWERFSFYGMKYLLLLYLTKYHLFTDSMGLDVLGSYAGLVYALPLIGGAETHLTGNLWVIIAAGLLVGLGTRLANGCTSGHGVCGISRLSLRGIVATLFYLLAGAVSVLVFRHMLGVI